MFLLKVCRAFNKYKIPYAVVGGHAVNLHGVIRGTLDIDFIIEWKLSHFKACEKALNEIGLVCRVPIKAEEVFKKRERLISEKNMIAWSFINPASRSEQIDIIITVNSKSKKVKKKRIQGDDVNVLDINELIKMKKESGRKQDLIDVEFLQRVLNEKGN